MALLMGSKVVWLKMIIFIRVLAAGLSRDRESGSSDVTLCHSVRPGRQPPTPTQVENARQTGLTAEGSSSTPQPLVKIAA